MAERIHTAVLALRQALEQEPLIQEYNRLAKLIKNHPDYQQQEANLKAMQQAMVHTLDAGDEAGYQHVRADYQQARATFETDPLLHNYLELKTEVNHLLQEITALLNEFDKK